MGPGEAFPRNPDQGGALHPDPGYGEPNSHRECRRPYTPFLDARRRGDGIGAGHWAAKPMASAATRTILHVIAWPMPRPSWAVTLQRASAKGLSQRIDQSRQDLCNVLVDDDIGQNVQFCRLIIDNNRPRAVVHGLKGQVPRRLDFEGRARNQNQVALLDLGRGGVEHLPGQLLAKEDDVGLERAAASAAWDLAGADGPHHSLIHRRLPIAADAGGLAQVAMQLQDPTRPPFLMKIVDVLGDHGFDIARCLQVSQGSMGRIGGGAGEKGHQRADPIVKGLRVQAKGPDGSDQHGIGLGPKARIGAAKIGDPRSGAVARPREGHHVARLADQIGGVLNLVFQRHGPFLLRQWPAWQHARLARLDCDLGAAGKAVSQTGRLGQSKPARAPQYDLDGRFQVHPVTDRYV